MHLQTKSVVVYILHSFHSEICWCSAPCFKTVNSSCLFFFTVLATRLGPSPQSSTPCQQTFPCCTERLAWLVLGALEISLWISLVAPLTSGNPPMPVAQSGPQPGCLAAKSGADTSDLCWSLGNQAGSLLSLSRPLWQAGAHFGHFGLGRQAGWSIGGNHPSFQCPGPNPSSSSLVVSFYRVIILQYCYSIAYRVVPGVGRVGAGEETGARGRSRRAGAGGWHGGRRSRKNTVLEYEF